MLDEVIKEKCKVGDSKEIKPTILFNILDFIYEELPKWRDDPDRPTDISEDAMTEFLCNHLSAVSVKSPKVNFQFQRETREIADKRCKIDIGVKSTINFVFNNKTYSKYDVLLPIECKRLPIPKNKDSDKRDEREYVYSQYTRGGIQRFKEGKHGSKHQLAGMIGYIQEEDTPTWLARVNGWISDLAKTEDGWSASDCLKQIEINDCCRTSKHKSTHLRDSEKSNIKLRHLWISMN